MIKLLHNWQFVQLAQVDPKVRRTKVFDEETMGRALHDVGHTLGWVDA